MCIIKVTLHDDLHGFRQGQGTETSTLEAKLLQQLMSKHYKPLFQVFIGQWEVYDLLDRTRRMEVFMGYSHSKKLRRLIQLFWED